MVRAVWGRSWMRVGLVLAILSVASYVALSLMPMPVRLGGFGLRSENEVSWTGVGLMLGLAAIAVLSVAVVRRLRR